MTREPYFRAAILASRALELHPRGPCPCCGGNQLFRDLDLSLDHGSVPQSPVLGDRRSGLGYWAGCA